MPASKIKKAPARSHYLQLNQILKLKIHTKTILKFVLHTLQTIKKKKVIKLWLMSCKIAPFQAREWKEKIPTIIRPR